MQDSQSQYLPQQGVDNDNPVDSPYRPKAVMSTHSQDTQF